LAKYRDKSRDFVDTVMNIVVYKRQIVFLGEVEDDQYIKKGNAEGRF